MEFLKQFLMDRSLSLCMSYNSYFQYDITGWIISAFNTERENEPKFEFTMAVFQALKMWEIVGFNAIKQYENKSKIILFFQKHESTCFLCHITHKFLKR